MIRQMYDYYVRPFVSEHLGEKGQDMVEYAVMLAIIVGIGWFIIDKAGLRDQINAVFTNAGSLMDEAKSVSTKT